MPARPHRIDAATKPLGRHRRVLDNRRRLDPPAGAAALHRAPQPAMTIRLRGAHHVELAAEVEGPWRGPAVVLLHGGGQTRHAWKGTGRILAAHGFLVVNVDQRGHGESDWAPDGDYSLDAYSDDLRTVAGELGRPVAFVGASLGGLASLLAAGEPPVLDCTALVLVDITPQIRQDGRARIGAFMRAHGEGFASVTEAADAVSRYLPHRPRPGDVSGLAKNLRLGDDGRYYWHWDPQLMTGRLTESLAPGRLDRAAAAVTVPMLLVRGTESEIVSDVELAAFRAVAPAAEHVDVPTARHMVAGDQNDLFTSAVVDFLLRHLGPEGAAG
jgi:non-heme chloroperoxidase